MAFQWPVQKIDIINSQLANTGNNLVNVADDGSDEWNVCSPAYERALAVMIEDYGWGFATKVGTLTASPTAPADTDWDTAFPLPGDLVHLIWVKINQNTSDPVANQVNQPTAYDILAGQLVLNAQGGPPPPSPTQTPAIVTIKYVSSDNSDPTFATPRFVLALEAYVLAAIYRGLHGDKEEGDKMFKQAEVLAQYARTRYNQQKPKTPLWNSRITACRRIRRPWPPTPGGWSGSGIPG